MGEALADTYRELDPGEARVVLEQAVRRLSSRDRSILYLRFFEELTQRDIGEEVLAIPVARGRKVCGPRHDLRSIGLRRLMAEMNQDSARIEALRGVVERVTAWQETAPEGTIRDELDKALREAGVTLTEEQKELVTEQISNEGDVNIDVLAADTGAGGPA